MCKRRVALRVCSGGECVVAEAYYHPGGCMGARYPHLDIVVGGSSLLRVLEELGSVRGLRLGCTLEPGGCMGIEPPVGDVISLCVLGGSLRCSGTVFLRRRRRGMVYLGPVGFVEDTA